ncbi:MAG: hypothetical protein CVV27_12740 [Candidatus Melainabacteria bacterium HGW-Melainabacteria-1]|nr:MAG: hypothetical protein CVV27_12740 [Candidatus Melainabacteria bacterium HGW-Melainabacteria-1]
MADQATAIYLEPQGLFMRVRYRIDGVLHQKTALPPNLGLPMLSRIKQFCGLDAENSSRPQHQRVRAQFNATAFELSLATYPSVWGESLALNIKYTRDAALPLKLDELGLSPLYLRRLNRLLGHPGGLLIVTGPARAGKSTTLYAACQALNLLSQLIVSAENPVEQRLPGVLQGNWTPEAGDSFAQLIQSMGEMNPEVMMVSGLDTPEAVKACVELALSGAKVMGAYQSFDTMGALQRLVPQGLEAYLIAAGQTAILSQRLVRRLCDLCKQPEIPSRESLNALGLRAVEPDAYTLWRAVGCGACSQGYSGQLAIHELLVATETLREAILARRGSAALRQLARSQARLISMVEDGYFKATQGLTSLAELQRVAFVNEYDADSPLQAEQVVSICLGEDPAFA